MDSSSQPPLLDTPDHVLSTLDHDGRRRWLMPRLSMGPWWQKRRAVAYALMIIFVAIPHIRIGGKPFILLDIAARKFTILGRTFLPNDTLVLALFMLTVFVSIGLITAIAGRAWCGWACPQTVYMEFLFRPIDRLFDGTRGKGGNPRDPISGLRQVARFLVYLALSMFLAHTFLAYFVGTERLSQWIRSSPIQHPTAFLVMAGTTGLMLFDFLFFREQMCTIACPYGRFQSVMLDRQSVIVGYDSTRGEPRKKGKRKGGDSAGDCVDCHQCVVVCPTGIDIRQGLQMECINCTQCIDACDNVMDKVGSPRGLIRFSSQDGLAGKASQLIRPRTLIYPLILLGVLCGLAFAVNEKSGFDARVIRGKGSPFTIVSGRQVFNSISLRLVNRTEMDQLYSLELISPESATLDVTDRDDLQLKPGQSVLVPLEIRFPTSLTVGTGNFPTELRVIDQSDNQRTVSFRVLGPR
jgi:cytochrome c oxidase accessory protein FixG